MWESDGRSLVRRWSKIYSESDDVNVVQKFIRTGHQETVDKCLRWIDEDGSAAAGETFCDAGCGVGTLAIPLAERGAKVRASDISEAMAMEGKQRAASMDLKGSVTFETADLETLEGQYDTTTCIDVSFRATAAQHASGEGDEGGRVGGGATAAAAAAVAAAAAIAAAAAAAASVARKRDSSSGHCFLLQVAAAALSGRLSGELLARRERGGPEGGRRGMGER